MIRSFVLIGIFFTTVIIIGVLFWQDEKQIDTNEIVLPLETSTNNSPEQQIVPLQPKSVATLTGGSRDASGLIDDSDTVIKETGFYVNSIDPNTYEILYLESQGVLTILLYEVDLRLARSLAERQLKLLFPDLTEDELCELNATVKTNQFVNASLSGINLGLSFCPLSTEL